MDTFPLDGCVTDLRTFARLGQDGVDLFLVDSTNAEVSGFTSSGGELGSSRRASPWAHRQHCRSPLIIPVIIDA